MPKFLSLYLVVTGGLALLALAAPWLVVAGLFLGLVPGIMLGLAPTAFFWGCVFTGSWFASGNSEIPVTRLSATYRW